MASDARRVVVTGAAGFVGLNVVERLLRDAVDAVAIDAAPLPPAAQRDFAGLPGSLREVAADITDAAALGAAMAGADLVIHAAAITAGAERELREARRVVAVNVVGTQAVLDAVAAAGTVNRLVYVSSGAVYGERAFGSEPIDEATPPEPASLYGITKLAGEHLVRRHGELHGTGVVIVRLSAVFGPWERDTGVRDSISPMYLLARAKQRGARVAAGRYAPRNWLYSRDAAAALCGLAQAPPLAHDLYNATPTEWFEPMRWAGHLGVELATESGDQDAPVFELPEEIRRSHQRAPVASDRICGALAAWPAFGPDDAFRDYARWLEGHAGYHFESRA